MTKQCTVCEIKHGQLHRAKVVNIKGVNICPECALIGLMDLFAEQAQSDASAVKNIFLTAAKMVDLVKRDYETKLGQKHDKN